jgi:hypothetical protein
MSKKTILKKTVIAATLICILIGGSGILSGQAQNANPPKAVPEAEKTASAYRVEFTISEVEAGKKINTRQYSMNLSAGDNHEIKIGTRVPFEQKPGEFTYIDVGTTIWCRLRDREDAPWLGNDVLLTVKSEISNFAVPDQQGQNVRPLLRQMKIEASTTAQLGKPLVVGSVDDPNSRREFELEVTVNKLR